MDNKILVVGAASKVGTELVGLLVAKGESVKAATRHPGDYRALPGVEATAFDYEEHASAKEALAGADRVFMLSKWTELHPELALNRFVEHALAAGVKHIVFLTAMGVDKNPSTRLALVEKRIADSGMGYTILRPNWFMQNFSRGFLLPTIRNISSIVVPAGFGTVSFIDARDIAEVAAAALVDPAAHNGQVYDLTGPEALSYKQAADILSEVTGRGITFQDASDDAFRAMLQDYWEPEQIDYLLKLFGYVRSGEVAHVETGTAAALGRPPTTFEQFARDHASAWR